MRAKRILVAAVALWLGAIAFSPSRSDAQAALLMEEPYGFFGALNPTGHNALYFSRICAETPVKLRRCEPGELGSVIARYQGIDSYDWVAMPLVPYLYSVDDIADAPAHVNKDVVVSLRKRYHDEHLGQLTKRVDEGNIVHGGWTQLVGVSYERRIYAFRFATTEQDDDALIGLLNDRENRSHFNLTYNNCADFARSLLNEYFPKTFPRDFFPDAGMTTPRQIAYTLEKYAAKHPELDLQIFEIPQVPGYRHPSHRNKSVSASLMTTGYAIPILLLNPYIAGGIFVDFMVRGRYPVIPRHVPVLAPDQLATLNSSPEPAADPDLSTSITTAVATGAAVGGSHISATGKDAAPLLKPISESHN